MANLIVLADGTGNSAAAPFKTNVWRLYQALDLSANDQIACFADGVGTSGFRPLQLLGLALGFGVKRNVLHLYKFLCRNYSGPADRIYGFGFSRGAFTIRELNALIGCEGLVHFESEEELDQAAVAAYRSYREKTYRPHFVQWLWVPLARFVRDHVVLRLRNMLTGARGYRRIAEETEARGRHQVRVHFIGVWDTVSAYGLPIDELTIAFDKWIWPMQFQELELPAHVDYARQALALDDERRTFWPLPWDEAHRMPGTSLDGEKLVQVWFAGAHANVGGGYPDDSLAHVPLCWMIGEASERQLRFKDWIVAGYAALASDSGPIYDSRAAAGVFYRYQPRDAQLRMKGRVPLVDSSVILRIVHGNDDYVPISLPENIDVLAPDGVGVPFSFAPPTLALAATPREKLRLPAGQSRDLAAQQARLGAALAILGGNMNKDRRALLDLVLDTVWWRRVVYFATLFLVALAALYPLFGGFVRSSLTEQVDSTASGPLVQLISPLRGLLPGALEPWLDAFIGNPTVALLLIIGIFGLLGVSTWLQVRIRDRARRAWAAPAPSSALSGAQRRRNGQRRLAAYGALFFGLWAFLSWLIPDGDPRTRALAQDQGLILLNHVMAAALLFCVVTWALLHRPLPATAATAVATPGLFLGIARWLRTFEPMRRVYQFSARTFFPLLMLAGALYFVGMGVNSLWFDIENSAGVYCQSLRKDPLRPEQTEEEQVGTAKTTFKTSDVCWNSGLFLKAGGHYRIWIVATPPHDRWRDASFEIGDQTHGFQNGSWVHDVSPLLKRAWSQNWFRPIARIGNRGNDEYSLQPLDPLAPKNVLVAEITARRSGELFLYVNDAVTPIRPWLRFFYGNNQGTATVTVERLKASPHHHL